MLENELETLIDRHGLNSIIDLVAMICGAKAEHVRSHWQDEYIAGEWETAENVLNDAVSKLRDLKTVGVVHG